MLGGIAPSSGSPTLASAAATSDTIDGWARFTMTPATSIAGSNVASPCATAASVREACPASITNTTGAEIRPATWAVEPKPSAPRRPSNSPITPSTTATSAIVGVSKPWRSSGTMSSGPHRCGSRLRPGLPVASAW